MHSVHFEWKVLIQSWVSESIVGVEVALKAALQVSAHCTFEQLHVFLLDSYFKAAVERGRIEVEGWCCFGGTLCFDIGGGVLVANLERVVGEIYLFFLLLG